MLAHVCRRWRSVVFQSPLRLNLRLLCTAKTRVRDTLDIWPPLPLIIQDNRPAGDRTTGVDNIIAALEHNDRVCKICLNWLSSPDWEYLTDSALMQKPFPELTDLVLHMYGYNLYDESWPILPDSFLGGTAPRLRSLGLWYIHFPGLPKLLLSATHLVHLDIRFIPNSGYILPEAMATGLLALTSLESLYLIFHYPRPRPAPESQHPPPLTRSILPHLTKFEFGGNSEYLEVILARIDAPRLHKLEITFFNQIIFDTPQLFQTISRTPTLRAPKKGHIIFDSQGIRVGFLSQTSDYTVLTVRIPSMAWEAKLSSLEQLCVSSLPPISALEDLHIIEQDWPEGPPHFQDDIKNALWLDVLRPFVAVKDLYLSETMVPRIATALQGLVGERTTEVLPTLQNIFWERGYWSPEAISTDVASFVAARWLFSNPVTVSIWDGEYYHS